MAEKKIKADQHSQYWTFTILALLIPVVGIVMGIIYLSKPDKLDKKVGEHSIAVSIFGLIAYGILIGVLNANGTPIVGVPAVTIPSVTTPITTPAVSAASKITLSNNSVKESYGLWQIVGEAKNTDSAAHTFIISATFYGTDGKIVGTATGNVNDLAAGDTKTYTLLSSDNLTGYKDYKVQISTMIQ